MLPLWNEKDPSVPYSSVALFHHIAMAGQLDNDILAELAFFFENLFLSWAEVACTVSSQSDTLLQPLGIVRDLISVCCWSLTNSDPHLF
jgi:hypothetical protein